MRKAYCAMVVLLSLLLPLFTPALAEGLRIYPARMEIAPNQSAPIAVEPADGIAWASDNPTVAEVDGEGMVRAVRPGEATITATRGGERATCHVVVRATEIITPGGAPTGVTVDEPPVLYYERDKTEAEVQAEAKMDAMGDEELSALADDARKDAEGNQDEAPEKDSLPEVERNVPEEYNPGKSTPPKVPKQEEWIWTIHVHGVRTHEFGELTLYVDSDFVATKKGGDDPFGDYQGTLSEKYLMDADFLGLVQMDGMGTGVAACNFTLNNVFRMGMASLGTVVQTQVSDTVGIPGFTFSAQGGTGSPITIHIQIPIGLSKVTLEIDTEEGTHVGPFTGTITRTRAK